MRSYNLGYYFSIGYQMRPCMSMNFGYIGSFVYKYQFDKGTQVRAKMYRSAFTLSLIFDIILKKAKNKPLRLHSF